MKTTGALDSLPRFVTILALCCCGCVTEPKPADADGSAARDVSCVDGFELDTTVGRVTNNAWNKQAIGSAPYRQCVRSRNIGGAQQHGWSWSWPVQSDTLLAYPQTVFGWKPWNGGVSTRPDLPIRVGSIRTFALNYSTQSHWKGKANFAASLWLTRSGRTGTEPNPPDISADLNIWNGLEVVPSATHVTTATIDGVRFEVWFAPAKGNASGASGNQWNHIVYRCSDVHATASLDIRKFLGDAATRGFISPDHYVSSIELGNEVVSGSGETWIETLSVDIR
jgi:Glycosyl hydrolase family 12